MDRSDIEKKWIIEIPKTANKIIVVGVYGNKEVYAYSVDVHDLDSYAEPDTEKVMEEAYTEAKIDAGQEYENGYDAGHNVGYQQGLSDAWEAAKKIAIMDTDTSESVTGYFGLHNIMHNLTASEAIEKIRQYEQEQQIQVGDEVRNVKSGWTAVVTRISDDDCLTLMDGNGAIAEGYEITRFTKTGRHFSKLVALQEEMRLR